ncbi:MAG: InlB B-repeat-containing protein, partial [Kiritimatiellaeota bacterium]|nr:InlB B-repeat-containing protein [Kiritimatiellota bacterium]
MPLSRLIAAGTVALLCAVKVGAQEIWYVDANSTNTVVNGSEEAPYKSLPAAVNAASTGDTIMVLPGTYERFTKANMELIIESTDGAEVTIIDGAGAGRCADMGTANQRDIQLIGFTLMNGLVTGASATAKAGQGGGAYGGTLTDCVIIGNTARAGGGAANCELINCTIIGNTATGAAANPAAAGHGGGAFNCNLTDCTVSGNTAAGFGGGVYGASGVDPTGVNSCIITRNKALDGGGVSGSATAAASRIIVNDCAITYNEATQFGGGAKWAVFERTDIVGNTAPNRAGLTECDAYFSRIIRNTASVSIGGAFTCRLEQCLVQGNIVAGATGTASAISGGATMNCTIVGNRFTSARNTTGVAVNLGTHYNTLIWDNTRTAGGSADKNHSATAGMYNCYTTNPNPNGGGSVNASVAPNRNPKFVNYNGGNFQLLADSPCVDTGNNLYIQPGWDNVDLGGNVRLVDGGCGSMIVDIGAFEYTTPVPLVYVAKSGNDSNSGLSWEWAKLTIQGGVDTVSAHGTVVVSNGVYSAFRTSNRDITVRSLNGPDDTIVDGGGTVRAATLATATRQFQTKLNGFTLRNGNATTAGNVQRQYGGGVYGGTVTDCVITDNLGRYGGGVAFSVVSDCDVSRNTAQYYGGGVYGTSANPAKITRSKINGNKATTYRGGGVYYCDVTYSEIASNSLGAAQRGGGAYFGTLAHCVITNNFISGTGSYGGGAYYSNLEQCLVYANTAGRGAGLYCNNSRTTRNCTIVGNTSSYNGAAGTAVRYGKHYNTIIWGNIRTGANQSNNPNHYSIAAANMVNCCTPILPNVNIPNGSVVGDPMFENSAAGNFRLQPGSSCIDAGSNAYVLPEWNGADLAGHPRIYNLIVDVGAYEYFDGVRFHWNDGESPERVELIVPENWLYVLPDEEMTRGVYTFVGWNTRADGMGSWITEKTPFVPADSTLDVFAYWVIDQNVVFNGNGGTPTMQETISAGGYYTLPPKTPARDGYEFVRWEDENGVEITEETLFVNGVSLQVVLAVWRESDKYEVILEPDRLCMMYPAPTTEVMVMCDFPMPQIVSPEATDPLEFAGYTNSAGKLYYLPDGASAANWDQNHGGILYGMWIDLESDDVVFYGNGGTPDYVYSPAVNDAYV